MRIAITGGSGFVGGCLMAQLRAAGHSVTQLARTAPPVETALIWSLKGGLAPAQLRGFEVLVHAAWDFADPEVNVSGSIRLLEAAKDAGVPRIVLISSLSAFEGCQSQYGATKVVVERAVAAVGGCSIRLGFVCDDTNRGLSGSLKKLATLPVIPLPGGGRQNLFAVRAEDLGPALLKILEHGNCGVVNLAHPEAVSLAVMLRAFATQQGKSPVFLPMPWRLLWTPLRLAEAAGVRLKFRSDSLVSLMNQNPAPDFGRLEEWGIALRAFDRAAGD